MLYLCHRVPLHIRQGNCIQTCHHQQLNNFHSHMGLIHRDQLKQILGLPLRHCKRVHNDPTVTLCYCKSVHNDPTVTLCYCKSVHNDPSYIMLLQKRV